MNYRKDLERISRAYDRTVFEYENNFEPEQNIPDHIRNSSEYISLKSETGPEITGSAAPEYLEFLSPDPGMKYLDAGCCANLYNYRPDKWGVEYYGIDISPKLINAMRKFAEDENLNVRDLLVADLASIPFEKDFFDIAGVIGVFEYYTMDYIKECLMELHRVLKPASRMVADIPNTRHRLTQTMFAVEAHLGRPNILLLKEEFENTVSELFSIEASDDKRVMIKYFLKNI